MCIICFTRPLREYGCHQVKPDGVVMSALPYQINESSHRTHLSIASVASLNDQVTKLLADAMSVVQRDQEGALEFVRRASALAGHADCQRADLEKSTRGGLAPWQIERVKRYIDKEYASRINIDDLAQMTRLSSSYFSAAFRISFGTSPHDYICRRRVDQAAHLMMNTDAPLCEIALDCGFADQSHLSRVFRRITGTTPAARRRVSRVA